MEVLYKLVEVSEGKEIEGFKEVKREKHHGFEKVYIAESLDGKDKIHTLTIGNQISEIKKEDRYNDIHNYRRKDEKIMLYYSFNTTEVVIVGVVEGDDLKAWPFRFVDGFSVTEEDLKGEYVASADNGLLDITPDNLSKLKHRGLLNATTEKVIIKCRKNIGFGIECADEIKTEAAF